MTVSRLSKALGAGQDSLIPAGFLALGTFAIGAEGFMIAPLLPDMARDFALPVPQIATLVVVFTLVLSLTSPLTTVATARLNRRDVLLLAIGLFFAGNLLAAWSPSFATLMLARVLMAMAAGLYTPGANALAGTLVSPARRGRALAIVSGGMTIAIALGLPLGALIGHAFGWRATFLGVAVMSALAMLGIVTGIPRRSGRTGAVAGLAQRFAVLRNARTRRLLWVTFFWSVGAYTAYPYIAIYLQAVLGFTPAEIGASISIWGAFAAIGVISGGALNDRIGADPVVRWSLAFLALSFLTLAVSTGISHSFAFYTVLAAIALWGFTVWSFFPAQMSRLVAVDPAQAPVSLALNTSTMYLGFSLGSGLGALVLSAQLIWAIGLLAAAVEVVALWLNRRVRP